MTPTTPTTPTTPYLIRAIYEWCADQGFTPHILVDVSVEGVVVPRQLVENDTIMLNIQSSAVRSLELGNEWIVFNARFSGKAMDVVVPVSAVRAIFSRENGLGCAFEAPAELMSELDAQASREPGESTRGDDPSLDPGTKPPKKPHLKLV